MSKLESSLKRHITWIVMLVVSIPLLVILVVQYRSLVQLGQALPVANRAHMRMYLATLASSVEEFYRNSAHQTLSIPADVFAERHQKGMDGIASYFERHSTKVAKRLFIGYTGELPNKTNYSVVYFYEPSNVSKFLREPGTAQWRAAHAASGVYLYQSVASIEAPIPPLAIGEADPENRVITKPIIDGNAMILGVAGMVVDEEYFERELLPQLIQESLQAAFPTSYRDVIIAVHDRNGNTLFETHPSTGKEFEVTVPLRFTFEDLKFKIMMGSDTLERAAKRLVAVNLSLSVLMTVLLIAGIYLALRTISREMKLSRMKSDFVSNVSHELRTPLASIRVFGEFFRLGWVNDPEKSREYGEYIENESRRLTHLVNNILDFSKIESGGKTYDFEEADVKEIVDETLKTFDGRLIQDGFNITLDGFEKEFPPVFVNRDAITQSLVNLIDNAIKYSGSSKKLDIRLGQEESYVTVSVIDYGVGIPREAQDRIFDKFYRVSTGLVHDVKGSGLGLSIVKHIMDAHRGKIVVKSQPGIGTTLTLYLPSHMVGSENGSQVREEDALFQRDT
jgi:signal transduction histidine kinase